MFQLSRGATFALLACMPFMAAAQAPSEAAKARLTLEDLYSDYNVVSADISPSGKAIAVVARRQDDDMLVAVDLATGDKKLITRFNKDAFGKQIDVHIGFVRWKTENRLLFQLQSTMNENLTIGKLSRGSILSLGNRLYAVDRDGRNVLPMLGEQYSEALVGAFDTSDIASMLWTDPEHILLRVGGWDGKSLFRVNVMSGRGKVVEPQKESVIDWWFDVDGKAIGRIEFSAGTLRYYRRVEGDKWKKYYSVRRRDLDELPDFEGVGPSDDPDKFYVRARPPGKDRMGVYLYDLQKEEFGEAIIENPTFDVSWARASDDGSGIQYHCYDEHVVICDFADAKQNAYMRGLRKFFTENANVYIQDSSDDGNVILLYVSGPTDPPAFYYYLVDQKKIEYIGMQQGAMSGKALPAARVVKYRTRDGMDQTGYLTYPPGAQDAKGLPLVLMPHGGPWARDRLDFNPWVQYLAARGYAVFQPNFRGSWGFGETFLRSGDREWGRKMQDDLADGVKTLADQGVIDPARVCIVGASYGGYAALAGATLTPTAYKCAVSLAGISDVVELVRHDRKRFGADSEPYEFIVRSIGDPDKDRAFLQEISPASHVDAIKVPVLLIHGDADERVPYSQSEDFHKLLQKAGRSSQLLRLRKEGHSGWNDDTSMVVLSTIGAFLWEHLGAGHGVEAKPVMYVFKD